MLDWLRDAVGGALTGLLSDLLLLLLAVGAAYAVRYIRLAADRLEQQSRHELVDAAIRRVGQLAEQTILALESAAARNLRQAVADGRVDRAELARLGEQAVREVLGALDAQAREALAAAVGDVRAYVQREVEARLEALKAEGVIPRVDELRAAAAGAVGVPK